MSCKKLKIESSTSNEVNSLTPPSKKVKLDDEAARLKKANRLKENLRQMLLPENPEDQETKKKNAIYAYNYFEKVEETFVSCGKESKFKKFLQILKSFDPDTENAVSLYNKLEKLFLPEHPDLIELFLTFLHPSEAYEAGKFFEHFMVTSMNTFINKLNIYFNKQPAQIRKIYNCLNELSEDTDLTMEKIKNKILPLLRGNQYLTEWFLQIFPDEKPPECPIENSENVNLKEIDQILNHDIVYETVQAKDLIEDSPSDCQSCQLKYINGRIFYGSSKLLLPAKLTFMSEPLNTSPKDEVDEEIQIKNGCVHGIRQLGEEYLKDVHNTSGEDNEKSDKSEDEHNKEKESPKNYEFCDDSVLRMHAARLNPSLYASENYTGNFYKTNRIEDGKSSPRKYCSRTSSATTSTSILNNNKEKHKSPKKSIPKSPISGPTNEKSNKKSETNVFQTARKLKALCDDDDNQSDDQNKLNIKKKKTNKSKNNKIQENNNNKDGNNTGSSDSQTEMTESECENYTSLNVNTANDNASKSHPLQPWTREEDKIILEEVKLGFVLREQLMSRIAKKLNDRKENEISERFNFLMDVLSKLKNKN